jgi:hypothetical protein
MTKEYTHYKEVDKEQLQEEIDAIKQTIGYPTWEDFQHLLKLERWGRVSTFLGFFIIATVSFLETTSYALYSFLFWLIAVAAAGFVSLGNVGRWASVIHPILHGAYDKVPNIPYRYTKAGYAQGWRRYIDWIKPDAWAFEHNIMHHYHLGEDDDPDNVE